MNIPSIESLYATIEQQQRVIKQAHEDIAKLTAERNALINQVDEIHAARSFLRDQNRLLAENHALKSALREAKEHIQTLISFTPKSAGRCAGYKCREPYCISCCEEDDVESYLQSVHDECLDAHNAIATINKVLGEE